MPFGILVWMIIILVLCGDDERPGFFMMLAGCIVASIVIALILSKHLKD